MPGTVVTGQPGWQAGSDHKEQVIDVGHKAVYAFVTGWLTDRWIPNALRSHCGTTNH